MASIWVTGSADGIGRQAAAILVNAGHRVYLHARHAQRAAVAREAVPGAAGVLVGDLAVRGDIDDLARAAVRAGPFDAIIHNAGVLQRRGPRPTTPDGLELTFAVNVLAPYLLTALVPYPRRLVYLSSQVHTGGDPDFDDLQWERRRYDGSQAYDDSKLLVIALAFAVARRCPDVASNAVDPGWVRSRMGGAGAPASLKDGARTAVDLATSPDGPTGQYFSDRHGGLHPATGDPEVQQRLLDACARISGVDLP